MALSFEVSISAFPHLAVAFMDSGPSFEILTLNISALISVM